jgi:CheY-like chemotaxis protein
MARILFVDDDPDTLETMTRAVQVFGHQAVIASNGQEALVKAASTRPDLIFIDMRLPDISGDKLISQLNTLELTRNVPICMLTASVEQEAEALAKAAGASEYLTKPIRLQKLIEIIRQYTES